MKITKNKLLKLKMTCTMLGYLRFSRRCFLAGTEVGGYCADVLGANSKSVTEIEIKTSINDLKNEFKSRTKIRKHNYYKNGKNTGKYYIIPNYYYVCVPEKIGNKSLEIVNKLNDKYGLIIFKDWIDGWNGYKNRLFAHIPNRTHSIIKPARKLISAYNDKFERLLRMRMSTELYSIYEKYLERIIETTYFE